IDLHHGTLSWGRSGSRLTPLFCGRSGSRLTPFARGFGPLFFRVSNPAPKTSQKRAGGKASFRSKLERNNEPERQQQPLSFFAQGQSDQVARMGPGSAGRSPGVGQAHSAQP